MEMRRRMIEILAVLYADQVWHLGGNSGLPFQRVIAPPARSAAISALYSPGVMLFS
jgi:hypothetical protein